MVVVGVQLGAFPNGVCMFSFFWNHLETWDKVKRGSYCKVATCDGNTRDTVRQVETHWIITRRSNPFFVLGLIQNRPLTPLPLGGPSLPNFLSLPFINFFLFTKERRHTNSLLWERPFNCIFFFLFRYSPDNFTFCLTFPLCIYFVYFHLRAISVSLSPVNRCLIKLIPWTWKLFTKPCWVRVPPFCWFKAKALLMSHLGWSSIVFHSMKMSTKRPFLLHSDSSFRFH